MTKRDFKDWIKRTGDFGSLIVDLNTEDFPLTVDFTANTVRAAVHLNLFAVVTGGLTGGAYGQVSQDINADNVEAALAAYVKQATLDGADAMEIVSWGGGYAFRYITITTEDDARALASEPFNYITELATGMIVK